MSKSGDLQKKRSSPKLKRFFQPNFGDLKKKKVLTKVQSLLLPTLGALLKKKIHFSGPNISPSQLLLAMTNLATSQRLAVRDV